MRIIFFSLIVLSAFGASPALAHGGHVGELAGHAHWLGWAAVSGAAALAAWAGKRKRDSNRDLEETVGEESAGGSEEKPAGAEA